MVKAVVAAVAAWLVATEVFDLAQPFLAPWMALLTVHASVYRSLTSGVQTVVASVIGVVLAVLAAQALGASALTLGLAILAGLLLSRYWLIRPEGLTIATTALLVLTTGAENEPWVLLDRIYDTVIGVGIGVLVNLVVLPPLNDRSAEEQLDRLDEQLGSLLTDIAGQMRSAWSGEQADRWIDRTRGMDRDLSRAWQLVRHATESSWWNPRTYLPRRRQDRTAYERLLLRVEEGIAQVRAMARTVRESTVSAQEWDPRFRERWIDLLAETGRRVADPDANVRSLRDSLEGLARDLSSEELPGLMWPTYGSLITNLTHVVDIVDDVATSRPART
jgi:uncharacterized membrane protein YgaE (UPF0421/DUF939 family)